MLGLAISRDQIPEGDLIETNEGKKLICSDWPQDSDTRLVCFQPKGKVAQVIYVDRVAEDIAMAIRLIDEHKLLSSKPDWLKRLIKYASGAAPIA